MHCIHRFTYTLQHIQIHRYTVLKNIVDRVMTSYSLLVELSAHAIFASIKDNVMSNKQTFEKNTGRQFFFHLQEVKNHLTCELEISFYCDVKGVIAGRPRYIFSKTSINVTLDPAQKNILLTYQE